MPPSAMSAVAAVALPSEMALAQPSEAKSSERQSANQTC
jgi:hypothetical protein